MNYKANAECMWNIVVPFGKKITLKFTHFDLEGKDILTSKCYDNIMVYDINSLTNALIQKHGESVQSDHRTVPVPHDRGLTARESNARTSHDFITPL